MYELRTEEGEAEWVRMQLVQEAKVEEKREEGEQREGMRPVELAER